MTWFTTDELISSTKLVRNFGSVLDNFRKNKKSKLAILKNNEIEAVIISKDQYKNFEKLQEYIEDLEDIALVKERLKNDNWKRYTHEEMLKKFNIEPNSL